MKKILLAMMLTGFMAFITPTAAQQPAAPQDTTIEAAAPQDTATVIDELPDPMEMVDAEGGWSEIHTVKGVTGWIRTDALTEADPNIYEETMYTQVSGSFLCEAPPESADPKPHKIGANTKVRIIARNGALCRVKYDGKCYYVPSQVLSPHKAGDGKSTRLSVGADVALHEDANLFSDSVGTVPAGSEVTLLGASHDAVKVRYAGSDGWVVDLDRLYAY